jgi:hypothetical protein
VTPRTLNKCMIVCCICVMHYLLHQEMQHDLHWWTLCAMLLVWQHTLSCLWKYLTPLIGYIWVCILFVETAMLESSQLATYESHVLICTLSSPEIQLVMYLPFLSVGFASAKNLVHTNFVESLWRENNVKLVALSHFEDNNIKEKSHYWKLNPSCLHHV